MMRNKYAALPFDQKAREFLGKQAAINSNAYSLFMKGLIAFIFLFAAIMIFSALYEKFYKSKQKIEPQQDKNKNNFKAEIRAKNKVRNDEQKKLTVNSSVIEDIESSDSEDSFEEDQPLEKQSYSIHSIEKKINEKKIIASRKNWREAISINNDAPNKQLNSKYSKNNASSNTEFSSSTAIVMAQDNISQDNIYGIKNNGEKIGEMTINPKVLRHLDSAQEKTLKEFCSNNLIVDDPRFVFKKGIYKLRPQSVDYRFFAHHSPDGQSNHFVVDTMKPKHDNKRIISFKS